MPCNILNYELKLKWLNKQVVYNNERYTVIDVDKNGYLVIQGKDGKQKIDVLELLKG